MLPKLAFNNSIAQYDNSLNTMRNHIEFTVPGILSLEAINNPNYFSSYSSFIRFGALKLAVHSHKAAVIERENCENNLSFMLPTSGRVEYTIDGRTHISREKHAGIFLSGLGRITKTTEVSQVMASLDRSKLLHVAESMQGEHGKKNPLNLNRDRELLLHQHGHDFNAMFTHLFSVIDSASGNSKLLEMMAIDDVFYRTLCMMLNPCLFLNDITASHEKPFNNKTLDLICAWIEANIHQPITLTCLEKLSGLSGRSLQTVFRKKYQCTPMQWVKLRRLEYVFKRLSDPDSTANVTAIAIECGFNHLGYFANDYYRRFGEYPLETLTKAQN